MNNYTCMWKYEASIYAYQTDDKRIANLMKRRGFLLFNYGWRCNHWVYHTRKKNQRDAINTLRALVKEEPRYKPNTDIWECC